jgi:hypothetical protein
LVEVAQVNHTVRQYLVELEEQNPVEEPVHQQEQVSTTDPDSTYATKGGTPARLGYYDNYLVDNHSCVIVGVQATAARLSQETVAAQDMITRFVQRQGREPAAIAADARRRFGKSRSASEPVGIVVVTSLFIELIDPDFGEKGYGDVTHNTGTGSYTAQCQ